jgi:hypothetical protein
LPSVRALRRSAAIAAAALLAAVAAGCGAGAGTAPSQTELLVTQDYGAHGVAQDDQPKVGGSDTVMRLLQRNVPKVSTRYGGGFVQSIDGLSGGRKAGRPFDWFFYVNGVESGAGATSVKVHAGDNVWWDYHDWGVTDRVPAVVGSFPEPFLHGVDGRKLPTRVECYDPKSAACGAIVDKLTSLGLPAFKGGIGTSFVADTLRILVGPWVVLRGDSTAQLLEKGPAASGVFAKPAANGKSITLLDGQGKPTRTLGAGTGLVAATTAQIASKNEDGKSSQDPMWIITGTDDAGVTTAASAFDEGALSGHFAVALAGGKPVALPEVK